MIFLLEDAKLAFIGVPKCMTTSLGNAFYQWQFGKPFVPAENGGKFTHSFWGDRAKAAGMVHEPPSLDKLDGYETFTVVRDPFVRCTSAYANKVVNEKVVEEMAKRDNWKRQFGHMAEGFVPVPNANFFFENIETYRKINPSVRHHTDPYEVFLGSDLSRIDHVFKIEDVAEIQAFISDRLGQDLVLEQRQKSRNKPKAESLSDAARTALMNFVKPDYELLRDYYQPAS